MATVRFSNKLRDEILRNANAVYSSKFAKLREQHQASLEEAARAIVSLYIAHHEKLFDLLPDGFASTVSDVSVSVPVSDPDPDSDRNTRVVVRPSLSSKLPVPTTDRYMIPNINIVTGYRRADFRPNPDALPVQCAAFVQYGREEIALEKKRDEFCKSVEAIITNFATLAPALKQWPPLWDLLPDDAKERHKEEKASTRSKPKDISELGVDVDKLSSTVVAHKLKGG